MMLSKLLFLLIALFLSCSRHGTSSKDRQLTSVCVDSINVDLLEDVHILYFSEGRHRSMLLAHQKSISNDKTCIKVGDCYDMLLVLLNTTGEFTDVGHRIGQNNLYIDNKLVFPVGVSVYKSSFFDNFCDEGKK